MSEEQLRELLDKEFEDVPIPQTEKAMLRSLLEEYNDVFCLDWRKRRDRCCGTSDQHWGCYTQETIPLSSSLCSLTGDSKAVGGYARRKCHPALQQSMGQSHHLGTEKEWHLTILY